MKVTLLDTITGVRIDSESGGKGLGFWWAEGNGSCDCNRRIFMGLLEEQESGVCEGCERFLIVATDDSSYSLAELNADYPIELLRRHGVIQ